MVKVIVAIGTLGDAFPFISLALALRRRGHRVLFLSNADHAGLAAEHGIDFRLIAAPIPAQDDRTLVRTFRTVVLPSYYRSFAAIRLLAAEAPVTVIASDLAIGAIAASEALGLPLVRVILSPEGLPYREPTHASATGDPHLDVTNRFRRAMGLGAIGCGRDLLAVPTMLNVCLFPRYFVPSDRTANADVLFAGFPFLDLPAAKPDESMVAFMDLNGPPIVCTSGTGVVDVEPMIRTAHLIRRGTGYPVIFLSRHLVPERLGEREGILFALFADLAHLLPRARLLFHHGGIGTLAQAVRAGIPQLIAPARFDQPTNARTAGGLGLAISLDRPITSLAAMHAIVQETLALRSSRQGTLGRAAVDARAADAAEITAGAVERLVGC